MIDAAPVSHRRPVSSLFDAILGELDIGIVLTGPRLTRISRANAAAVRMLDVLGGAGAESVPPVVSHAARDSLALSTGGRFGRAAMATAESGRRFMVRAKPVSRAPDVLLLITPRLPRANELNDALRGFDMLAAGDRRVVTLACQGLSNKEIATTLGLSEGTVKQYLHRSFRVMGVASRSKMIALVERRIASRG